MFSYYSVVLPVKELLTVKFLDFCFHSRQPPTEHAPLIVLFPAFDIRLPTKSCQLFIISIQTEGGPWCTISRCIWGS
jgi:hypothetical protein